MAQYDVLKVVSPETFEFWSGGKDTVEELTFDELATVFDMFFECWDGYPTETDVNDFFWFERDTIADWLGFNDFDEILERNKNDQAAK